MKKMSLKQWILMAGVFAVGFSCQSKKTSDSTTEPNTQCEEQNDEDASPDDGDDEMSNLLQIQTEEKAAVEPAQEPEKESSALEKQEEPAPAPTLTESAAPEKLSVNPIQDTQFVPEIDLETLAKMFSIESEPATETQSDPIAADAQ